MKQEDKELLLKDLCARLPYNTKIQLTEYSDLTGEKLPSKIKILNYLMLGKVQACCKGFRKDEVKPYLFPLSSMTVEQIEEINKLLKIDEDAGDWIKANDCLGIKLFLPTGRWVEHLEPLFEWFNKNHFDYRGLIEEGLAIDAGGLNIY